MLIGYTPSSPPPPSFFLLLTDSPLVWGSHIKCVGKLRESGVLLDWGCFIRAG